MDLALRTADYLGMDVDLPDGFVYSATILVASLTILVLCWTILPTLVLRRPCGHLVLGCSTSSAPSGQTSGRLGLVLGIRFGLGLCL